MQNVKLEDIMRLALEAGFSSYDEGEIQSPYAEDEDISLLLDRYTALLIAALQKGGSK